MEFLLNEKSLCGQFQDVRSFLHATKSIVRCIDLIHQNTDIPIYKTMNFYDCNVTKDETLCDLKCYGLTDELLRFKSSLDREIYEKPHWDQEPAHDISQKFFWNGEDISATSIAEAAVKKGSLLSFDLDVFNDKELLIQSETKKYIVDSINTPQYLVKNYNDYLNVNRKKYLQILFEDTRIDCGTIEEKYGVDILEKEEFESLIKSLKKFTEHESWESIALDDGLEYKKYTPKEKEKNWFKGCKYSEKTIMKIRFSGKMRCFGYRKGDKFKVLRLERDHRVSNNG